MMKEVLAPGSKVDRYVIEGPLGQGGMGSVYRALDTRLRRRVALKVVRGDKREVTEEMTARMMREARAVAALSHPNVVTVFDVGESEGFPYLAMEMLTGSTLRGAMHDDGVTLERKLRWLVEIADALAAAHRAGIIHRDVKPENVMVLESDTIKVLDFGIARAQEGASAAMSPGDLPPLSFRTAGGNVAGTPKYMAPEHVVGVSLDARADQFAWGLVAYEVLTLKHPRDERPEFSAAMGWSLPARSLEEVAPDVPPPVARVVMRAIERDRGQRWPTMDAIVDALVEAVPALEAVRGRRAAPGPLVETGAPPSPSDVATTVPVTTQTPTRKVDDDPKLVEASDRLTTPPTRARRGVRAILALAATAAMVSGFLALRRATPAASSNGAGGTRALAAPLCALDESPSVELGEPLTSYGIVATDAGALVAGEVPVQNDLWEVSYVGVARLPDGTVRRRFERMDNVRSGIAYPTNGSEPLVVSYLSNATGGGTLNIGDQVTSDAGPWAGMRTMMRTPLSARRMLAGSVGDAVFAAASGVETSDAGAPSPVVRSFVHQRGTRALTTVLAQDASIVALAADEERAAVLLSTPNELSVVFFDRTSQPMGSPVVLAKTTSDAGAITFRGTELIAIWLTPPVGSTPSHWETATVGVTASPPRKIPGTEGAGAASLVAQSGNITAAWVKRTAQGSELRMGVAADPVDLPASSTVLRTAPLLSWPSLSIRGDSRWLAWREGHDAKIHAARFRCN